MEAVIIREKEMPEPDERDTVTSGGSLTPERFANVRRVFEAALGRHPSERRAYLEGACGGDRALLEEIEGMLIAEVITALCWTAPFRSPVRPRKAASRRAPSWRGAIGFWDCWVKAAWGRSTRRST